jgi:thiamine pyrophosphokinase
LLKALVVADGDVPSREIIDRLLGATPDRLLVVAADGGAIKAESIGLQPDVVVGDADSLTGDEVERLRAAGAEVIVHPRAKDQSDSELAVREALGRGATSLLIVGAFGGRRLEHTLANVLLLSMPELAKVDVSLADGASTLRVVQDGGRLTVAGRPTEFVSLLPLSDRVTGVTTDGLAYALSDATLTQGPTRGLSNEMLADEAAVMVGSGRLAVVHTRRTGEER